MQVPRRVAWCLAGCLSWSLAVAQPAMPEATVKAAFIYNFLKFVDWPADAVAVARAPMPLCWLGARDSLYQALSDLEGKPVQGRELRIRHFDRLQDMKPCRVLVVGGSERRQLSTILPVAREAGSLTVSDLEGFVDADGMIGLVVVGDRVQFEVNLKAAQSVNLNLSSRLLKLALRVKRE